MNNNKNLKKGYGLFLILLLGSILFKEIPITYAIDPGDYLPTAPNEFTTNIKGQANYLNDALESSSSHNYLVDLNFTTSNSKVNNIHYKLMKNLVMPKSTEKLEKINGNPIKINDKGIHYILIHGFNRLNDVRTVFPGKSSYSENEYRQMYYVTQIALWLYIYEHKNNFTNTLCADGACDFTTTSSGTATISVQDIRTYITNASKKTNYGFLAKIITLVDGTNNYQGITDTTFTVGGNTKFNYTIDADFKNIITDAIGPSYNTDSFMYYSLEVDGSNPYGVYFTDENGVKIDNPEYLTDKFKIVIPLKEDITTMNLSSIKVKIYGYFLKDDKTDTVGNGFNSYQVTSTSLGSGIIDENTKKKIYSDMLIGDIPYQIKELQFTLYNFVKLSKINASTGKELSGALLKLMKEDSEDVIEQWVSSNKAHYVHLENGEYKLCEEKAPEGFALNTECVAFTVDNTKIVNVVMKNEPVVPTDDTGLFKNKNVLFIGFGLILSGLIGIFLSLRNKKASI